MDCSLWVQVRRMERRTAMRTANRKRKMRQMCSLSKKGKAMGRRSKAMDREQTVMAQSSNMDSLEQGRHWT